MKRFFIVLIFFGGILLHPTLVSAHAGPGPPFLKVNGRYAQTNPYYQGDSAINIPQDTAPEKYLPNQLILFEVDTSQLLVPVDIAQHTQFRWTLITGAAFMDVEHTSVSGIGIQRSFNRVGSYLLQLEAEGPGEYTYNIIDTVQVNIVPNQTYSLPQLTLEIGRPMEKNNFSVLFVSKAVVDPSAKQSSYLWDLGDKTLLNGVSQTRDYTTASPINYLYARIIDGNGISTDVGIDVWKNDNSLEFHPFGNMLNAPITIKSASDVQKELSGQTVKKKQLPIAIIAGALVLVMLVGFAFIRPKKAS